VHSELEQLLILQDREQKIRQIRTEIETVPLRRQSLESQLAASKASLEALKQRARQAEMDRKTLELDVGTRTQTISRLKTQQYQTRKNDEFQAISHDEENKAAAAKDSVARQTADLDEKSKALDSQLKALTTERSELAGKIDEDLLGRFERLFKSKGDAAVVAIEHGVCTGCHMKVTTATASQVRAGKEMVSCENCGRILYFGDA
jgi:predicted  nucleic acid-binding Zn-ribbon protein